MAISNPVYEDDDSVEEQIRAAAAAGRSANKAAPTIEADEEAPAPVPEKTTAKMPMRPGQASSGTKTPIVTKEQLAASGLSLRDYLNKQQGLTRRDGAAPSTPNDRAESRGIRNAIAKSDLESGRATVQRQDADKKSKLDLTSPMSALRSSSIFEGTKRGGGSYAKGGAVKKMASGGSVSSASKRADGIAMRGKTKGKMC